jgi:hypothetical protein
MNNGTQNDHRFVYQVIQDFSACVTAMQFAPAGLSIPVPAHPVRSCSTRSWAMNLARSDALHVAQKPTFPAIHEMSGLEG